MIDLSGRRILFVGIGFYDYERCIVERLRARGATVVAFEEQPRVLLKGAFAGFLARMRPLAARLRAAHERRLLEAAADGRFDQVLVIKATGLSPALLQGLRERQPGTEFVLYQWDSMARLSGIAERRSFFDRVLSFDRRDVEADATLQFRPLFFRETADDNGDAPDLDVSFVGWLHSDRLESVRAFQAASTTHGLRTKVYLYTGLLTWMLLALRGQASNVHFRPLSHRAAMALNRRSRCVLDLPHAAQSGLTMRAIEALGLDRKLITTGTDVVHYDFYRPGNVAVVHPRDLEFDPTFVRRPVEPVPESVRQRYGLDRWIDDVVGALPADRAFNARTRPVPVAG